MYKIILATMLSLIANNIAIAQQGGFQDPSSNMNNAQPHNTTTIISVVNAKQLPDDSRVTLRGNIIKHLSEDHYLFRDASGDITVEIDDDKWNNNNVNPQHTVEIVGEIEKDRQSIEVDVDHIRIITD